MKKFETIEQFEKLLQESYLRPVLIFKHSNQCPTSDSAKSRIGRAEPMEIITEQVNILIVQEAREVSNMIEKELGVKHESPQIIVVRNGQVVYHESHDNITPEIIEDNILENE